MLMVILDIGRFDILPNLSFIANFDIQLVKTARILLR